MQVHLCSIPSRKVWALQLITRLRFLRKHVHILVSVWSGMFVAKTDSVEYFVNDGTVRTSLSNVYNLSSPFHPYGVTEARLVYVCVLYVVGWLRRVLTSEGFESNANAHRDIIHCICYALNYSRCWNKTEKYSTL